MEIERDYIRLINLGILSINGGRYKEIKNVDFDKRKEMEECINMFFNYNRKMKEKSLDYKNRLQFFTSKNNFIEIEMDEHNYKRLNGYGIDSIEFYTYEGDEKIEYGSAMQKFPKMVEELDEEDEEDEEEMLEIKAVYGAKNIKTFYIKSTDSVLDDKTLDELTNRINEFIAANLCSELDKPFLGSVEVYIGGIILAEIKIDLADLIEMLKLEKGQQTSINVQILENNDRDCHDFTVEVERVI